MEQPELKKDINLMPYHQEVDPSASTDLEAEQVLSDQGDIDILEDNSEEEMKNTSFDDSQHNVVKSHIVSTPNVHTSLEQF